MSMMERTTKVIAVADVTSKNLLQCHDPETIAKYVYTHIFFIRASNLWALQSTRHLLGCSYHGNSHVMQ